MNTETGHISKVTPEELHSQKHMLELKEAEAKFLMSLEPKERLQHIAEIKVRRITEIMEKSVSHKISKDRLYGQIKKVLDA